jgi:UDP-GlcNAc:undecaprenyl-phosphate GlcNAc-1-phosphate transferase
MDGIVAGIATIAFVCYFYATSMSGQYVLSIWSGVLLGVSISLYYWNKIAGLMFLGDSGSQIMGFLLASMGILYNPRDLHPESSWFLPIMLLGVPIFDTTLVVLSRLRRKQPIGTGRRDHTYHRLIAMGLSPKMAVFTTHIVALLVSGLAFFTLFLQPATAILVFFTTLFCGIITLIWFERKPTLDGEPVKRTP